MSLIKTLQRLGANRQGIAAVEFALTAPLLIVIFLGGFEFSRNLLYQLKLEKMAFTIADVTAQNESLTNAQVDDIFQAAGQIFLPANFTSSGRAYISSVYRNQGSAYPTVLWQRSYNATGLQYSEVGNVGLTATLPNGLSLNEKDNVIVVEIFYQYTPLFQIPGLTAATYDFKKTSVFKPRLGALTTNPT